MLVPYRPVPPLASYVECLWYYQGYAEAGHQERVLPNGRFQVVVDLGSGRGAVSGMRSHYVVIDPAAIHSAIGIVFLPGGTRGFLPGPAEDYFNQFVPLDLLWGSRLGELHERLSNAITPGEKLKTLEMALLEIMHAAAQCLPGHAAVNYALEKFRRRRNVQSVLHVTRETGLSRRRLSQLFREQVGTTPKLYCRLLRFRQVLRQIASGAPVDWADVALACGYYDQAHLAHEFREFCGLSPGRYLATERPHIHHVRVA